MSQGINEAVQHSFDRDAVRDAVLALAATLTSAGKNDQEHKAAILPLIDLIGNVRASDVAEGIGAALRQIADPMKGVHALERDLTTQGRSNQDVVRGAVIALADTLMPDEQFDPADDPRPEVAVLHLIELIENMSAQVVAEGVSAALHQLIVPS